jgi:hypothetical protein
MEPKKQIFPNEAYRHSLAETRGLNMRGLKHACGDAAIH